MYIVKPWKLARVMYKDEAHQRDIRIAVFHIFFAIALFTFAVLHVYGLSYYEVASSHRYELITTFAVSIPAFLIGLIVPDDAGIEEEHAGLSFLVGLFMSAAFLFSAKYIYDALLGNYICYSDYKQSHVAENKLKIIYIVGSLEILAATIVSTIQFIAAYLRLKKLWQPSDSTRTVR